MSDIRDHTSSLFLEPRKCRATCSGSMLVTSASFQRLISYTFSFCSWTSIFHRNRVRASFSTCRKQQGLMAASDQYMSLKAEDWNLFAGNRYTYITLLMPKCDLNAFERASTSWTDMYMYCMEVFLFLLDFIILLTLVETVTFCGSHGCVWVFLHVPKPLPLTEVMWCFAILFLIHVHYLDILHCHDSVPWTLLEPTKMESSNIVVIWPVCQSTTDTCFKPVRSWQKQIETEQAFNFGACRVDRHTDIQVKLYSVGVVDTWDALHSTWHT